MRLTRRRDNSTKTFLQRKGAVSRAKMHASFVLDDEGVPRSIERRRRHFKIKLWLDDVPDDTFAVTYCLHESYKNPLRESMATEGGFEQFITSYGDYEVVVCVRRRRMPERLAVWLSEALRDTYNGNMTPEIESAIAQLSGG